MATPTYTLLADTNLGSSVSSISLNSISQSYKNLVLNIQAVTSVTPDLLLRFNNVTSFSYEYVGFASNQTGSAVGGQSAVRLGSLSYPEQTKVADHEVKIVDYTNTAHMKNAIIRGVNATQGVDYLLGVFEGNAITSIQIVPASGTLNAGTVVKLYGLV